MPTISATTLNNSTFTQASTAKPKTNAEVRANYNAAITKEYEAFKKTAAQYHENQQCFGEEVARKAFDTRNEIKSAHREETSYLGMAAISVRNLFKYGSFSGPTSYDDFAKSGKNPEEIAYSAFKTNGADLGLANNGVGEYLDIWSVAKSKGNVDLYPEAIDQKTVECIKSHSGGKFTKDAILASYDVCVPQTPQNPSKFKVTA